MKVTMCQCDRCQSLYAPEKNSTLSVKNETDQPILSADLCESCRNECFDFVENFIKSKTEEKPVRENIDDKVVALAKEGKTTKEIAEILNRKYGTIYKILRKNDTPVKKLDPLEARIDMGKIKALHDAGRDAKWIAGDMGLPYDVVVERINALKGA